MIEAKLKVYFVHNDNSDTKFYGKIQQRFSMEHMQVFDYDKRGDMIPPCGVHALLNFGASSYLDIVVDKHYFECNCEDNGLKNFYCHFHIENCIFEFNVYFDSYTNEIKDYNLQLWERQGEFEDGEDADRIYYKDSKEFITIEKHYQLPNC